MRTLVALILLWTTGATMSAQDIRATATAPAQVQTGQQFTLKFEVNAKPDVAHLPEIEDFAVLAGPSSTSSSSVNIINGKVDQRFSVTYTYYLQALGVGIYSIPPATFELSGQTYATNALKVEVVQGSAQPGSSLPGTAAPVSPSNPRGAATPTSPSQGSSSPNIYLRTLLSKTTVYQGEPIQASIKLFSRNDISSTESASFPAFEGFYVHDVPTPAPVSLEPEEVDGVVYGTAVLKRYTVFPQKTGEIDIKAPTLNVTYPQRVSNPSMGLWDDWFGPSLQYVDYQASGPARKVTVLPLPEGKPAAFSGGVGSFTCESKVDKTSARTNDAIMCTITISGSGNIQLLDPPSVTFPPDFEVYDPKTTIKTDDLGIKGSKTFEYLIIPRHSGSYNIPGVSFSYFDPAAKVYKTVQTEGFTLEIEKGEEGAALPALSGGVVREDVQYLGQDIRYINLSAGTLQRHPHHFFGTIGFWLCYLLPALLFALALWWRRRYIRIYSDNTLRKHLKASKYAAKRLKKARSYLEAGKQELFFEETSRALWGYLSDKLNIPVSELSKEAVTEKLQSRSVSAEAVMDMILLIDTAEFARYAPSAVGDDLQQIYARAVAVISRIQKDLSK